MMVVLALTVRGPLSGLFSSRNQALASAPPLALAPAPVLGLSPRSGAASDPEELLPRALDLSKTANFAQKVSIKFREILSEIYPQSFISRT